MTLILFVCSIASPDACHEERLSFSLEPTSSFQCMLGAQPRMAEWAGTNPKWRIARWKCIVPGSDEHAI
jgi:hypothetical protein